MRFTLISCEDSSKRTIEVPKEMIGKVQQRTKSMKKTNIPKKTKTRPRVTKVLKKKRKKNQTSKRLV